MDIIIAGMIHEHQLWSSGNDQSHHHYQLLGWMLILCGFPQCHKPPVGDLFIPLVYVDLGDGVWLFYPHQVHDESHSTLYRKKQNDYLMVMSYDLLCQMINQYLMMGWLMMINAAIVLSGPGILVNYCHSILTIAIMKICAWLSNDG